MYTNDRERALKSWLKRTINLLFMRIKNCCEGPSPILAFISSSESVTTGCNFSWSSGLRRLHAQNVITECSILALPPGTSEIFFSLPFSGRALPKMDSLSTANVEFCLDVFKELSSNHAGDNVFFSPLSLLYALSMILLGARGDSAAQMEKVLGTAGVPGGLGSSSGWLSPLYPGNAAVLWKKNHMWAKHISYFW